LIHFYKRTVPLESGSKMNKIARFSLGALSGSKLNIQPRIILPVLRLYSDESGGGDTNELSSLLKRMKSSDVQRKSPDRELNLAKPKFKRPIRREKDGRPRKDKIYDADLDEDTIDATKSVARLAKSENKKRKTESDLLHKLRSIARDANEAKEENEVLGEVNEPKSMSSLFSDLKLEKSKSNISAKSDNKSFKGKQDKKELTMEQLAFLQKRAKLRRAETAKKAEDVGSVDLHSGTPLGIFEGPMPDSSDKDMLKTWRACQQRELEILATPSPRNALEEMVLLTKQGKLWHFPINNEQGLDYSDDPFYNHVFLEHHLEPWCPKAGPVRHFMEVVCLGLSKNPFVTSQKKIETILWFKEYFERPDNNEILVHSGLWEESSEEVSL